MIICFLSFSQDPSLNTQFRWTWFQIAFHANYKARSLSLMYITTFVNIKFWNFLAFIYLFFFCWASIPDLWTTNGKTFSSHFLTQRHTYFTIFTQCQFVHLTRAQFYYSISHTVCEYTANVQCAVSENFHTPLQKVYFFAPHSPQEIPV